MMEDAPEDAENTTHVCQGPPQQVVHPPPTKEQTQEQRLRNVEIIVEMQAAKMVHDNFAVHKQTLQDALHEGLSQHFHGTDSTMGAALQLGLTPAGLVGKPRDLGNVANHPEASPSDQKRAAFVAGSPAWLNSDEQARAEFAALGQASAEAAGKPMLFRRSLTCTKVRVLIQTATCRKKLITMSP